jgi:hypothetical protein
MDKNMTDLVITIPLTLTASQIIRGCPKAISDPEALELALELHDLIGEVRARFVYVKLPLVGGGFSDNGAAFDLADLVEAVRRTILGFWPENAEAEESIWLAHQLMSISDDLYNRYLLLHDKVQMTSFGEPLTNYRDN